MPSSSLAPIESNPIIWDLPTNSPPINLVICDVIMHVTKAYLKCLIQQGKKLIAGKSYILSLRMTAP